ncbi:MAG: carboxypeptidase-like regulatory domain-containing protein [Muribaculaceae bacterium]|nr:carboxypeptidase-like regulatory domain-containing protein [Muribaculaceae bacterium]
MFCLLTLYAPCEGWTKDVVVTGVVRNKDNKKKLPSVSLTVPGTNIGTVSNADGYFTLKIPDNVSANGVNAELLGYKSNFISGRSLKDDTGKSLTIWLEPSGRMLDEVTVYGADPRALIETAIRKIPQNYSSERNLFSSFYRETVQKGKRYIGVSEAIVSVLKNSYKARHVSGDRVQIEKGRRLVSQRSSDTLSVKVSGGPAIPVMLDIVKNGDLLFNIEELDYYDFKMKPMTSIDDRLQFVVSFKPIVKKDYPLYKGKVFIDVETSAISKAEFAMDMSDKDKAIRSILQKKPQGLRFNPQEMDFVVAYKYQDGLSYLNYISAKIRFKCDWKRRLFSAGYTVNSELVMVDRDDNPIATIASRDAFRQKDVFYDMVDNFSDPDFWKDYNIIEPTESLEKAVLKLKN